MPGSDSPLALAAWLRARDDDALRALLRARPVRASGIKDVFDLAEALLEEASVQAALERQRRPALAVLAASGMLAEAVGEPAEEAAVAERLGLPLAELAPLAAGLEAIALLERTGTRLAPRGPVDEALRRWPERGHPGREDLVDGTLPALLEPVPSEDLGTADRVGAERAFAATSAIGELLHALEREPARRLQRGGIALPDWRRLLAATGAADDEELDALLGLAESAGLVETAPDATRRTEDGAAWHGLPRAERWAALAAGWLARVPEELRDQLRARVHWGDRLSEYLEWLYPAGGERMRADAAAAARAAELLGIASAATPSRPGTTLLAEGPATAAAAMAELFPPDVRQVYIQHDLSVIAPGPLAPDVDERLRGVADVEAVGVASSYRITAASVTRALTAGLGAEEVRALLAEVSLTGIPQPLEYLLAETSARFGSLRVGALDGGGTEPGAHAYVRADDAALVGQLVIDQALAPLALRRTGDHRAVTRFDAEALYWALLDARYPVVLEDADGVIRAVRRAPAVRAPVGAAPDPAEEIVARLREAAAEQPLESGAAWNARQLELAIRNRLEVIVTVRMPDGAEVPYVLEPAALAGGRLRARDRRADIERTLPLSHIVDVAPAPPAP